MESRSTVKCGACSAAAGGSRRLLLEYFVSADLEGPGLESPDDIATRVTNRLDGRGFYAVDAMAEEFSQWGPGGQTDAGFSMSDDGAQESEDCATKGGA